MSEKVAVKRWYACQRCKRVDHYYELDDGMTTFPRGEFLGHRDYLATGFESEADARKWLDEHPLTDEKL